MISNTNATSGVDRDEERWNKILHLVQPKRKILQCSMPSYVVVRSQLALGLVYMAPDRYLMVLKAHGLLIDARASHVAVKIWSLACSRTEAQRSLLGSSTPTAFWKRPVNRLLGRLRGFKPPCTHTKYKPKGGEFDTTLLNAEKKSTCSLLRWCACPRGSRSCWPFCPQISVTCSCQTNESC